MRKCEYCGNELWGPLSYNKLFMQCSFCGHDNIIVDLFGTKPIIVDDLKTIIKGDHSYEKKK